MNLEGGTWPGGGARLTSFDINLSWLHKNSPFFLPSDPPFWGFYSWPFQGWKRDLHLGYPKVIWKKLAPSFFCWCVISCQGFESVVQDWLDACSTWTLKTLHKLGALKFIKMFDDIRVYITLNTLSLYIHIYIYMTLDVAPSQNTLSHYSLPGKWDIPSFLWRY